MSLAPDLRRLARVVERIEDEGGEVEDVDVTVREQAGSLAEAMAALSGISNREVVFNLRVSADGVSGEELDETVHDSAEGVADEDAVNVEVEGGANVAETPEDDPRGDTEVSDS